MNKQLVESLAQLISSLSEGERNLLYEMLGLLSPPAETTSPNLRDEPFIGMWKNREEMQDSSQWVRNTRQQEWLS
jgi:hypothetical protein